jgi:hypothetical protein
MKYTSHLFAWVAALVYLTGSVIVARAASVPPATASSTYPSIPSLAPAATAVPAAGNPFPGVIPITTSALGAHSVRTADLDNDGDMDVIVAARGNGRYYGMRTLAPARRPLPCACLPPLKAVTWQSQPTSTMMVGLTSW